MLIVILAILSWESQAQSLQVVAPNPTNYHVLYNCADQVADFDARILNTSGAALDVHVEKQILSLAPGAGVGFQWGSVHYAPVATNSFSAETIMAGDSSGFFVAELYPSGQGVTDIVKFCFYDDNNPSDSVCLITRFSCMTTDIASSESTEWSVYHNPDQQQIVVQGKYDFDNANISYRLTDLQGRKAQSGLASRTISTETLEQGVYLVQLFDNERILTNRKLFISK